MTRIIALTVIASLLCTVAHARDEEPWTPPAKGSEEHTLLVRMNADADQAGRFLLGGGLAGAGLAGLIAGTEVSIAAGELFHREAGFIAGTGGYLLAAGIPTLIVAAANTNKLERFDRLVRPAMGRYRTGKLLAPIYASLGSVAGTIGLVVGVEVAGEDDPSPGAFMMSGAGYAMVAGGGLLALQGDQAMVLSRVRRPRAYIGFGAPLLVVGGVSLAMTPLVRVIGDYTAEEPQALVALATSGGGLIATGAAVLAIGSNVEARHRDPYARARRATPTLQILSASPSFDVRSRRVSFDVVGRF